MRPTLKYGLSPIPNHRILNESFSEKILLFCSTKCLVSENEIENINNFLRSQGEPEYVSEILNLSYEKENHLDSDKSNEQLDDLYETALEIVKSERKASTSFLQRKLQIGYNRAARIIDMMEEKGIVSKANHVGKREVL